LTLVPELVLADADLEADQAALTALVDWCARFSPAVAPAPPDGLFLDITGLAHLWGGEAALTKDLVARLGRNGIPVRVAVADTPGAAWALAHFSPEGVIVAPVGETACLDPLPAAALRLAPADAAQIARLGIHTIGALAALPREQVTRRFGTGAVMRLDQALGRIGEALTFRRPPNPWLARLDFADPISAPEDLVRVTCDITTRLARRLEAEGQGARRFDLTFHRCDGVARTLTIGLALPGRDVAAVARLFAPKLETVDPGFGLDAATLTADGVEPLGPRQASWDRADASIEAEEAVAALVDRLTNRLGQDALWRADAFPSHDPERAVRRSPPLSPAQGQDWDPDRPRPVRLLRRPEPIEVMAPIPDDPPVIFRWRGVRRRVRRAEGPERLAEEWWRRPYEDISPSRVRDYYRVEDEAGARFWLFRDGLYQKNEKPGWWMHGLFG